MPYNVKICWRKNFDEAFVDNRYSRAHTWTFDGGMEIEASSSPHVVPVPMSKESAIDPEEAFVASLSSCHMLWFLSIAAGKKFIIESYEDNAEGILEKNAEGKLAITDVALNVHVTFTGETLPSRAKLDELHKLAHEKCYIANSVKAKIRIVQI
jgi:organic hydroperoxide reductase OsmC/OhrA